MCYCTPNKRTPVCANCAQWLAEENAKLKQERDELAAHNKILFEALRLEDANNFACGVKSEQTTVKALSITPSAALREIQARTLDEAAKWFDAMWYEECGDGVEVTKHAEDELRRMAAAKRKGE